MKRLFGWLFSTKSKSKKYKYEVFLVCYLLIVSILVIVLSNVIDLDNAVDRVLGILVLFEWILLFIPCIIRLFDIADYNEKKRVITGAKQLKFEPLLCSIFEIEKWIAGAKVPDTIYVKGINENKIISVTFEVNGKNGPFVNKKILVDGREIASTEAVIEELKHTCVIKQDCVYLLAITEFNDPKDFKMLLVPK